MRRLSLYPLTRTVRADLPPSRLPWSLAAAFERAVYTTKSFLIALALLEGRLTVEQAALASQVEVDSQIDLWGEVEDSQSPPIPLARAGGVTSPALLLRRG